MKVVLHPHAQQRLPERGATVEEIEKTILEGERFPARFGRTGFRHNFTYDDTWRDKVYHNKQIEAYAVRENDYWLVITIIVKYY